MKFRKLLLSILALITLSCATACSSTESSGTVAGNRTNVLGIYKSEPASFAPVNRASGVVRSDEICTMELPSGNKVSWLWGLITYIDY